jgi:catechol 2,3-dioxygenase-like lactoylglutathione lyase family enzyme
VSIRLDHAIVPSRNKVEAARRLAGLLDVPWEMSQDTFSPVHVNETLTLDFADRAEFEGHHLCFHVSDDRFDAIFDRLRAAGIPYRSRPRGDNDMQINTRLGGRNLYWEDTDGHLWEILTVSYARQETPVSSSSAR